MPTLSIIIPVFNVERFLDECVQSVFAQTYQDWEMILVDDGSTDSSGKICESYAQQDNRIKVIHKPNGGLSSARNAGLDIAKGKYVTFIDSDDYFYGCNTLKDAIIELDQDSSIDIVQFPFRRLENQELLDPVYSNTIALFSPQEYIENLDIATCKRNLTLSSSSCGKIYRFDIFKTLRFPHGQNYEDTYLLCDIFETTPGIKVINKGAYAYRIHSNSITGGKPTERNVLDRLKMQLRVLRSLMKHSKNRKLKGEFVYDIVNHFLIAYWQFGSGERFRSLIHEFEKEINPSYAIWDVKTAIKAFVLRFFGVMGWIRLKTR